MDHATIGLCARLGITTTHSRPYNSQARGIIERVNGTVWNKGLKIYDEIERDTHAHAMLQKRKKTLVAREWAVTPASDDARDVVAAELVEAALDGLPFDRICEDLLDATLKGFAVSEVVWGKRNGALLPRQLVSHDQRRFAFDLDWRPRLLTMANLREGEKLPHRKFLVHRYGVKGNNPYGLGLGYRLFWAVLFKREGVAFWLKFLEKFAAPTVVGKSPYDGMDEQQRRFVTLLQEIRSSSAVVVPIGSDVEFLEAARTGSVTYQDFLTYWDKQISICVTGETLTTDVGQAGSRAASETHAEMLELLVDGDSDLLSDTLRATFGQWIVDLNIPGATPPYIRRTRPENQTEIAQRDQARAEAAKAVTGARRAVLASLKDVTDDEVAREVFVASGLTDGLSDGAVDALLALRYHPHLNDRDGPVDGDPVDRRHA